jgi:hypothetical protein
VIAGVDTVNGSYGIIDEGTFGTTEIAWRSADYDSLGDKRKSIFVQYLLRREA